MENKKNPTKFHGMGRMIARKTGYSEDYVYRVLCGTVNRDGKKAKHILELAGQLTEKMEAIWE